MPHRNSYSTQHNAYEEIQHTEESKYTVLRNNGGCDAKNVDDCRKMNWSKNQIRGIKSRLDEVFGANWNCFMASSRCWALKTYKPGTNLVFEYEGMVYDIFQAIDNEQSIRNQGPTDYLMCS
ncbi:hypothetical protein TSMEX_009863 [Taenia solium]|eukprot:TsM_000567600 transcript=TsM_000567600 gene=TsM_000567600